jgi:protein involved in polysaccharide export with SLBB domain
MAKLKWIAVLGFIVVLTGCAVPGTFMNQNQMAGTYRVNGQVVQPKVTKLDASWVARHSKQPYVYRVGPSDILNVIVWDHPELTTPATQMSNPTQSGFLVSAKGYIAFPFAGQLKVAGLTIQQIQTLIARKISKYIRHPQITVRVVDFRSKEIQVLGQVGGASTMPLTDRRVTLFDAINKSGGVEKKNADTARIFIVRGDLQHLHIFWVDAKSPIMMMVTQRFILRNNDVVYIPPVGMSSWNRVLATLLPTLGLGAVARSI